MTPLLSAARGECPLPPLHLWCTLRTSPAVHQVQGKQMDTGSHKRPIFEMSTSGTKSSTQTTLGIGQLHHQSATALSCTTLYSRRCRSSSVSWSLVSYTRCWMTDQVTSTRFRSGVRWRHVWCYNSFNIQVVITDVAKFLGEVSSFLRGVPPKCLDKTLPVNSSCVIS